MSDDPANTNYQVRALTRGLAVLSCFTPERPRQTLQDLSKLVHVPKGTLYRLLETLVASEFLEADQGGMYTLGIRAFEIGSAYLAQLDFPQTARRALEELAVNCKETASLGVLNHGEVVYVAIERAQREVGIQSQIGTRHPAHCTALGKVMLADLDDQQVQALLEEHGMPPRTAYTLTTPETMLGELREVRKKGYAIDNEERAYGVKCVAAPIRNAEGRVIGAISASGPAFRVNADTLPALIHSVTSAAATVSRRQGYRESTRVEAV